MNVDCPVCGKKVDKQGLENHMRLTNGMGHGPPGEYPTADDEERRVPDADEIMVEVHGEKMDLRQAFAYLGSFADATNGQMGENSEDIEQLTEEVRELREAVAELTEAFEALSRYQAEIGADAARRMNSRLNADAFDGDSTVFLEEDRVIRQ